MLWLGRVFSDQRWEIHQVVAERDTVVLRCTHHGRQTGELMGIPPTNREVAYEYVHIVRYRDGKAVEHWGVRDDMTLMRQLGVLPEPPTPASVGA
jgi:predicted ester cyclase